MGAQGVSYNLSRAGKSVAQQLRSLLLSALKAMSAAKSL